MKKKILNYLCTTIVIVITFFLIGCNFQKTEKRLDVPTNLFISDNTLFWSPVNNASSYTVRIQHSNDGEYYSTTEKQIEKAEFSISDLPDGNYKFSVKTNSDSKEFDESDYCSSIKYIRMYGVGKSIEAPFGRFEDVVKRESYLGYGINIIDANGITSKNIKVTYPIFSKDAILNEKLLKSNEHYSNLETIEASSISEFKDRLSISSSISSGRSISAAGNIFGIDFKGNVSLSGGLESSFYKTTNETYSQYFLEILAENQNYWLMLQTEESRYKELLSKEFKEALYNPSITPAELFDKYGTHILTSVAMGGNISMFYTMYSENKTATNGDFRKVALSLKTGADIVYGGLSAGESTENSFESIFNYMLIANDYGINIDKKIFTSGGSGDFGIINERSLYKNYANWQKSLDMYPVVVGIKDSNSLYPIWKLIDTNIKGGAERANELYSYFIKYGQEAYQNLCKSYDISEPVQPIDITNINVKNVSNYQDGEIVNVKSGDKFQITFDVVPDNAIKYLKTFTVDNDEYAKVDEYGNVEIFENAPSGAIITITAIVGQVKKEIKMHIVKTFNVVFKTGIEGLLVPSQAVESSSFIKEPYLLNDGYEIEGWYRNYENGIYSDKFDFNNDRINSNLVLWAKWIKIQPSEIYDAIFYLNENSIKKKPTFTDGSNSAVYKITNNTSEYFSKIPRAEYYIFTGWYYTPECINGTAVTNEFGELLQNVEGYISNGRWDIDGNIKMYAKWEQQYKDYEYISNKDDFLNIKESDSKKYMLINNIDFQETTIFIFDDFNGVIEGNNYKICNFLITTTSDQYVGLFKSNSGTIQNLVIDNAIVDYILENKKHIEGVVGILTAKNNGSIKNCEIINSTIKGKIHKSVGTDSRLKISVGGICGYNYGEIINSKVDKTNLNGYANIYVSDGAVEANVGAISGINFESGRIIESQVTNSILEAMVRGGKKWTIIRFKTYARAGAISGYNFGNIFDCYEDKNGLSVDYDISEGGEPECHNKIGAIVGENKGTISNCKYSSYNNQEGKN